MQEPTPLDPPEQELEEALASLALSPTGIPAESLWYRAALARERRRANRWRAAAAIAIAGAAAVLLWRPKPTTVTVDHVVVVREQTTPPRAPMAPAAPAPPAESGLARNTESAGDEVASAGYLRLRDRVLRDGLGDLPPSAGGGVPADAALRAWPVPDETPGTHAWPKSAAFNLRGG